LIATSAIAVALFVVFGIAVSLTSTAARHNTVQTISIVFFAVTLIRQFRRPRSWSELANERLASGDSTNRIALALALAAGALAYASTVSFYFVSDDFEHMNQAAHQPFVAYVWGQLTQGQVDSRGFHLFLRPLGFASLFVDYRLWHLWAPGYHVTNLMLHLLSIAGVFFFCKALGLKSEASGTAALFFAILPVNVEAVTWIGCRFDQLATAFMLWALVFYVRFRQDGHARNYLAGISCFVLAAFSKETAYLAPLLWIALEFVVWQRPRIKPLLGLLGVVGLCFVYRLHVLGGIGGYRMENGAPAAPLFGTRSVGAVLIRVPAELLFGYNWLAPHQVSLAVLASATSALLFTLTLTAKRTDPPRVRLLWFSLIWIFVTGLPSHFLFRYADFGLTWSRNLYAGAAGTALLVTLLLEQSFDQKWVRRGWTSVLACLFVLALLHNLGAWRTNSTMSRDFLGVKAPRTCTTTEHDVLRREHASTFSGSSVFRNRIEPGSEIELLKNGHRRTTH
jgi:hypothetical protein